MDSFLVKGPCRLKGRVKISGSKNSSLPILFASLLTGEKCEISNVPDLADIKSANAILSYCGKKCSFFSGKFTCEEKEAVKTEAPYDMVRKMRASVLIAGPMLARFSSVKFALPGGCAIGVRPIDIHLEAFSKMGASVSFEAGNVLLKASSLKPAKINFKFPSVGATENVMMAAALIKGETVIYNAAREPEISDLADVLNKMGAKVIGAGEEVIRIRGASSLKGFSHEVICDRIEAGTFLIAACALKSELELYGVKKAHLGALWRKLILSGAQLFEENDKVYIVAPKKIKSASVSTGPYPLFPTDLQAQWMAYMCLAEGRARIKENIFENRFMHAAELMRMGAKIEIKGGEALISGPVKLSAAPVMASDLRAGAALIIAAMAAEGESLIKRVYHIDRGYEKIEEKLFSLGAEIKRIKE